MCVIRVIDFGTIGNDLICPEVPQRLEIPMRDILSSIVTPKLHIKLTWTNFQRAIFGFSNNILLFYYSAMSSASTTLLLTTSVQTNSILSRPDDLMCIKDYLFKYIFEVQHTLLVLYMENGEHKWTLFVWTMSVYLMLLH